jgi:hypothetical protein
MSTPTTVIDACSVSQPPTTPATAFTLLMASLPNLPESVAAPILAALPAMALKDSEVFKALLANPLICPSWSPVEFLSLKYESMSDESMARLLLSDRLPVADAVKHVEKYGGQQLVSKVLDNLKQALEKDANLAERVRLVAGAYVNLCTERKYQALDEATKLVSLASHTMKEYAVFVDKLDESQHTQLVKWIEENLKGRVTVRSLCNP